MTIHPSVKELSYARKSIRKTEKYSENNEENGSINLDITSDRGIELVTNITTGKRIDSYGKLPWFDDALR